MRTSAVIAASLGVLAFGLVAPAAAQAAPSKPAGQALIHIEGGTAHSKQTGKKEYRILLPQGASIAWLGDVKGRTTTGTFTSQALVAGWSKLGHSTGKTALTTLRWTVAGAARPSYATVLIGDPRINAQGQLTFRVNASRIKLPATMPDFGVNVAWARPTSTRAYPLTFSPWNIDSAKNSTAKVGVQFQSPTSGTLTFTTVGVTTPCWSYSFDPSVSSSSSGVYIPGVNCGNGHVDHMIAGIYISSFSWTAASASSQQGCPGSLYVGFGYTPTGGNQFPWEFTIAMWDSAGNICSVKS